MLLRLGRATRAAWIRLFKNMSLFGINALLSPLIVLPITVFAADHSFGLRPAWWSGWLGLGLDVLLLDLWIYWWHRANHELQFLWRFHSVHHLDETLDTSSALRFHFGEVVLSACVRGVVIVVFDLPLASVLLFEAIVLTSAIFHHSDAKLPPGSKPPSRGSSSRRRSIGFIITRSAPIPTAITVPFSVSGTACSDQPAAPDASRACRSASRVFATVPFPA